MEILLNCSLLKILRHMDAMPLKILPSRRGIVCVELDIEKLPPYIHISHPLQPAIHIIQPRFQWCEMGAWEDFRIREEYCLPTFPRRKPMRCANKTRG